MKQVFCCRLIAGRAALLSSVRVSSPYTHWPLPELRSCFSLFLFSTMAPRILLCGDVLGRLNQLFKRVSSVRSFFYQSLSRVDSLRGSVAITLNSLILCRSTNRLVHSMRFSAWVSSSPTRRTSLMSSWATLRVERRFLFRLTSSATMALVPLKFYWQLLRTRRTAASRWTAWRFARICIGWKAVANSPSWVCFLCVSLILAILYIEWHEVSTFYLNHVVSA